MSLWTYTQHQYQHVRKTARANIQGSTIVLFTVCLMKCAPGFVVTSFALVTSSVLSWFKWHIYHILQGWFPPKSADNVPTSWIRLYGAVRRILVQPVVKMPNACNVSFNFRQLIAVESWYRYFPLRKLNGILSYISFASNCETRRIYCYMSFRKSNTCETEMLSSIRGFSTGWNLKQMHIPVQFMKKPWSIMGVPRQLYSWKLIC